MALKNKLYGIIGFLAFLLGFLSKAVYRDFVNQNGIEGYGISGFLPSYFYVWGFSLLLLMRPVKRPGIVVSVVTAASILFELMQYQSTGSLDLKDILASIVGGMSAILAVQLIGKWIERKSSL